MIRTYEFKREVWNWSKELGVKPKEIHLRRGMRRKWASCSSKGRLTFSNNLLYKPLDIRSQVVVHELLHLRYPYHNKAFNSLLVAYLAKKGIKSNVKF